MKFSQRIGKTSVREALQVESMDRDLVYSLWNSIFDVFFNIPRDFHDSKYYTNSTIDLNCIHIWKEFFKNIIDDIPTYLGEICKEEVIRYIRDWFLSSAWYEKFDFIEFLCQSKIGQDLRFAETCNIVLKKEMSGYRIIYDCVVPITSEEEIVAIEEAFSVSSKMKPVREHLKTALEYLSDRNNPVYRNSIKESISAVESICQIITGDKNATLGVALKRIKDEHRLHQALQKAFSALYGYTSNSGGIRHPLLEDDIEVTQEDAKFMLISCSAFINYLICKANGSYEHQ